MAAYDGNIVSFSVVAGQDYVFSMGTASGNGHYDITVDFAASENNIATPSTVDWGRIVSSQFTNQTVSGESNYEFQASLDGFLTIRTSSPSNAQLSFEVYDGQMNLIASRDGSGANSRLDILAQEGETYLLKVTGDATGIDFLVDNLVSLNAGQLTVNGTNQSDSIHVDASHGISVDVNGVGYQFSQSQVQNVTVLGRDGDDSFNLQLGSQDDLAATRADGVSVHNDRFSLNANQVELVQVDGGGGRNTVSLLGTEGNDSFWGSATTSVLNRRAVTQAAFRVSTSCTPNQQEDLIRRNFKEVQEMTCLFPMTSKTCCMLVV